MQSRPAHTEPSAYPSAPCHFDKAVAEARKTKTGREHRDNQRHREIDRQFGEIGSRTDSHHLDRDELALLVLFAGIWIVPLASFIDTGIYRREATLLPVAMLLNRLPTPVVLAFAAACVYVAAQMSPHFFDNRLI